MKRFLASRRLLLTTVLGLSSWTIQAGMAMTKVDPAKPDSIIIQKLNNNKITYERTHVTVFGIIALIKAYQK